jgi:HD superfamily phosphohydrolase
MLTRKDPEDIFDSIVSSQFDADRLDYLPRDRYMSGIGGGQFDAPWLLDCLEVGDITVGVEGQDNDFVTVPSLYLSEKGLHAAESYVLARFYLYSQVYLHKTTRSAEKMLSAVLSRVSEMVVAGHVKETGLYDGHPLVRYFGSKSPTVEEYLALDDVIVWSSLSQMRHAAAQDVAELAQRLIDRRLYKCIDIGARSKAHHANSVFTFKKKLRESGLLGTAVLEDTAKLTPYGIYDYDDKSALQKVLVAKRGSGKPEDLADLSPMVKAVETEQIYRTYAVDQQTLDKIEDIWRETIQ